MEKYFVNFLYFGHFESLSVRNSRMVTEALEWWLRFSKPHLYYICLNYRF